MKSLLLSERFGGRKAVVIGASIAGLLAARVLADHFDAVTVVERDDLSAGTPRKGIPQARHLHALLARAHQILEDLFPGITAELLKAGATELVYGSNVRCYHFGGFKAEAQQGLLSLALTRALLDDRLIGRVRALANVHIHDACDVTHLVPKRSEQGITGVRVAKRGGTLTETTLEADLVVDASGRGARTPRWLAALGYGEPLVSEITVHVGYATRCYRRPVPCPYSWGSLYVLGDTHREARTGAIFCVEGNRWMTTLAGVLHDYPPDDEAGFLAFARSLPSPEIHDVIAHAEPLDDIVTFRFPSNLRRHYERMNAFPDGLIVVGDASCSVNPMYGQGITTAAIGVEALDACLRAARRERGPGRLDGFSLRFQQRLARELNVPWMLSVGEDLRNPRVLGARPPGFALLNAYLATIHRLSHQDPDLVARFFGVMNMVASPSTLFTPSVLARVLYGTVLDQLDAKS